MPKREFVLPETVGIRFMQDCHLTPHSEMSPTAKESIAEWAREDFATLF